MWWEIKLLFLNTIGQQINLKQHWHKPETTHLWQWSCLKIEKSIYSDKQGKQQQAKPSWTHLDSHGLVHLGNIWEHRHQTEGEILRNGERFWKHKDERHVRSGIFENEISQCDFKKTELYLVLSSLSSPRSIAPWAILSAKPTNTGQ